MNKQLLPLTKRALILANLKVLRPSLKAFIFAYVYVTLPKVISHIISGIKSHDYRQIVPRISKCLARALHPYKFPAFLALLIAIINILEPIVARALVVLPGLTSTQTQVVFLATLISSFIASSISFKRFQQHILGYGRFLSLDLTLLVVSRAIDTTLSSSLGAILPPILQKFGDGLLFIASCTPIMYSWFFRPHALPPAYRKWITSAANMDEEFISMLKGLHDGTIEYGKSTDKLDIYCQRYGKDTEVGDIGKTIPLLCETVHAFKTPNCELHALWRFFRGFKFAFKLYGTINTVMLIFPKKIKMYTRILRAIQSTIRSSCFLATFIMLDWYGVCLVRTRLGPKLFPNVPKERWDKTIGPAVGSFLSGFSGFVESAQRRKELALFVFPRAIGTFVPTEETRFNLLMERLAFLVSMAVLVAFVKRKPLSVRGIFGRGLRAVVSI